VVVDVAPRVHPMQLTYQLHVAFSVACKLKLVKYPFRTRNIVPYSP